MQRTQTERFPWRVFWVLFAAGILSMLAIVPIGIDLFKSIADKMPEPEGPFADMPLPLIILIGAAQNILMLGFFILAGLWLARRIGLGAPLIESRVKGETIVPRLRKMFVPSLVAGACLGVVITIALILLLPHLPNIPFAMAARIALWKRVLVCFYGGIYEELLTRLFLLSLFAWLFSRFTRKQNNRPSNTVLWAANILVAILFGLGHLPSASLLMPITPLVVAVALAFNGIASMTFGYLYWTRGLESAMLAHWTGDFVIYVIGASLVST